MVREKQKDYKIISLFVVITLFVLLPFAYNSALQDPELTLRFLLFSGLLSALFFILLIIKAYKGSSVLTFLTDKYTISFIVFLSLTGISAFRSFDTAAAIYDLLRITLMFLGLVISTYLFGNNYLKKEHIIMGTAIAVLFFSVFETKDILSDTMNNAAKGKHFGIKYWYGSTLANKNLYCETLFMFLPFLAGGVLSLKGSKKYLCLVSLVISLGTILFLQSLSVFSAVIITSGLLIITLYYYKINIIPFSLSKKAKAALLSGIAIALVGCAVLFVHTVSYDLIKHKFSSLFQFLSENDSKHSNKAYGSFTERMLLWQHTFRMIKDYPLFGCGLSNWKTLLPHYGVFGITFMDAGTLKFEHPHNDYLLITAETGIAGLIAYLLIFFFILKQAFLNFKKSISDRSEALGNLFVFYGITGFMILSMFEFPKERFYPFLMLMILFALVNKNSANKPGSKMPFPFANQFIFIPCLILSIYSGWFFAERYKGENHFSQAVKFQGRKDWAEMKYEAVSAKSCVFKSDRLAIPLDWYAGFASFYEGDILSAQSFFERSVQLNPYFIQGWNDLGTCYERNKNFPRAISCYKTALSINPAFSNTLFNLIAVYYNMGRTDTAYQLLTTLPAGSSNPQYKNYILTILRNKLNTDFSTVTDEPAKSNLEKRLKNDRYILNLFFQSKKLNTNIDSLIYKEIKK